MTRSTHTRGDANRSDAPKSEASRDSSWIGSIAFGFYHDSRLTVLILTLILVAGASSFAILPRMEDPVLVKRAALITTPLPGADAQRVESQVSEKIENRLRDIEEIKEIRSISRGGISTISVELLDSVTESGTIWSRVRSRLEDSLQDLPPDAGRPQFDELEVRAHALIVGLTWNRDEAPDYRVLRRLAADLQDVLQNLPGTDTVSRFGDPGEEIEIEIDPARAASLSLTPGAIADQVTAFDVKRSAGQVRRESMELLLEVGNQLDWVDQISDIPIRQSGDGFVRLGDLATVQMGVPDPPSRLAMLGGRPAVVLGATVRSTYRIDRWTTKAEQALAGFRETMPDGIKIDSVLRQSDYVDQRLQSLASNLLIGAAAISLVIYLLMGWRSAVMVTLTLPLASLMVLFFLRVVGIPIHQMSVTGLIISLGLLIDNAIVIVDEVRGRLRSGQSRIDTMVNSVRHLAIPLLGSTVTTALAFAPIALMPGPAGEFVGSIAISVIFAIFSSLFLALTLIPTIAARWLPKLDPNEGSAHPKHGWLRQIHENGLRTDGLASRFQSLLHWLLRRPLRGIAVSVIAPVLGFAFFPTLNEQFFPPSDRNQFHITVEGPATNSLSQTQRTAAEIDLVLQQYGMKRVDWFFGESAPQFYYNVISNRKGTSNYAQALVTTTDAGDPVPLIRKLQSELSRRITSSRVLVRQLEQGPPFDAPVEVRVFGPDLQTLRNLGDHYRQLLSTIPEVTYCRLDMNEVLPQVSIGVDGESARMAGLEPNQIARQLFSSLEGRVGGSILQDNEELPIIVRVKDADRGSLNRITSMDLVGQSSDGDVRLMPLDAVADVTLIPETAAIPRLNRRRMNEVAAFVQAGVLPSVVQARIEQLIAESDAPLPRGYRIEYGGEASKRDDAVGNLFSTVGVLAVLMAATLVMSFGSFRLAAIIASVAALSIGLGLGALEIARYPFGFMAIIGTMGLIGVAINDSIVVLAAISANARAAGGDIDAIVHEVMYCSRHVVATTFTTMVGFAPLILDGGRFWPPMAVCIAGGVAGATLLALVLVPSAYRLVSIKPCPIADAESIPIPMPLRTAGT
ncbi:efflux RND transporter permease subunit [Crateriforma conspicua]|nr:efflux RND transporter permease subunit [Crateriforma conspicua]